MNPAGQPAGIDQPARVQHAAGLGLLWGLALALAGAWAVRHEMSEMQDDSLKSTAEALVDTLSVQDLSQRRPPGLPQRPTCPRATPICVSSGKCCRRCRARHPCARAWAPRRWP
jgi:hypothetical protein